MGFDWSPIPGGDYSSWESAFADKISTYCENADSFAAGISVFGDSASQDFFDSMRGQKGIDALGQAVQDEAIPSYITGKGGYIAWEVIGVLLLILSIILTFACMKCFRDKFRKRFWGACNDRPRDSPDQVRGSVFVKGLAVFAILALLSVAIATFVYAAQLSSGANAVQCDFWQLMRSYFFGSLNTKATSATVTDWKGSVPQQKAMTQLKETVNPRPPSGDACVVCRYIINEFNGTNGLVETLSNSRDKVMLEAFKGAFLAEAVNFILDNTFSFFPTFKGTDFDVKWFRGLGSKEMGFQNTRALAMLLARYADDLNKTTEEGIKLFGENLDYFLGQNSDMLFAAYGTAVSGSNALLDVDYVIAKIVKAWDDGLGSAVSGLFVALFVLCCLLGCVVTVAALFGSFAFWRLNKAARESAAEQAPRLIVKALGVAFVVMVVTSALSFLLSGGLLYVATVGSDGCGLIDQAILREGRWGMLPGELLTDTPTKTTDIATVLDTCVKEDGDGDVAGALGVRLLVDQLGQGVEAIAAQLNAQVADRLQLPFKSLKTAALATMTRNSPLYLSGYTPFVMVKQALNPSAPSEAVSFELPLNAFGLEPMQSRVSYLNLLEVGLVKGPLTDIFQKVEMVGAIATFLHNTVVTVDGIDKARDFLNEMAGRYGEPAGVSSFCSVYLEKTLNLCNTNDLGVLMVSDFGRITTTTTPTTIVVPPRRQLLPDVIDSRPRAVDSEIVNDPVFLKFLDEFKQPDDLQNLQSVLAYVHQLIMVDYLMSAPLSLLNVVTKDFQSSFLGNITSQLDGMFDKVANGTQTVKLREVFKILLSDMVCGGKQPTKDDEWDACTFEELLQRWKLYQQELADTLQEGFDNGNQRIMQFVEGSTIGSFMSLLHGAHETLQDTNCQLVGTALKEEVASGLCNVTMPAVASLGLITIFTWAFTAVAAWVAWKVYHYYSDLQSCATGAVQLLK